MASRTPSLFTSGLNASTRLARKVKLDRLAQKVAPGPWKKWRSWRDYQLFRAKVEKGHHLVDTPELQREQNRSIEWLLQEGGPASIGDYVEFGVYYGSSLLSMHRVLDRHKLSHVRLFGFDSWEGLPEAEHPDDTFWRPGAYRSNYRFTQEFLTREGVDWKRVSLVKGFFCDTLNDEFRRRSRIEKVSVIMIDCDMYASSKEALDFCAPYIKDRAVIIFDDWNAGGLADRGQGEKRAFDEFLAENPRFRAEEFGAYSSDGRPYAKLFTVEVVPQLAEV